MSLFYHLLDIIVEKFWFLHKRNIVEQFSNFKLQQKPNLRIFEKIYE